MARLKIPAEHIDGLAAVRALNDIQAQSFASVLDSDTGHKNGDDFAKAHSIQGLEPSRAALVYDTLRELYRARDQEHAPLEDFASSLIESMRETGRDDLAIRDEDLSKVKARLTRLLNGKGFGIEAKINGLRRDYERQYCSSRVLTDLRPVFGLDEDVSKGPVRMLVTHTLRLSFHDYNEHKDIYVSLTDAQIGRMIRHLQRAQEKAKVLTERFVKDE